MGIYKGVLILGVIQSLYTAKIERYSFNLPRVISVAALSPDNVQTSADQQIVLLNPFMEAR